MMCGVAWFRLPGARMVALTMDRGKILYAGREVSHHGSGRRGAGDAGIMPWTGCSPPSRREPSPAQTARLSVWVSAGLMLRSFVPAGRRRLSHFHSERRSFFGFQQETVLSPRAALLAGATAIVKVLVLYIKPPWAISLTMLGLVTLTRRMIFIRFF